MRRSERTMHFAFRDGKAESQRASYSEGEVRKTSIGRVEPLRRSMRMLMIRTGK